MPSSPAHNPEVDAHQAATRWLVLLDEPLVPPRRVHTVVAGLADIVVTRPVWADAWMAGLLTAVMRSLPDDDPWRTLSGRVTVDGQPVYQLGDPDAAAAAADRPADDLPTGPDLPAGNRVTAVCWSRRGRFGSGVDHTDLAWPEGADQTCDPTLAGGHTDLPGLSAVLLAGAGRDTGESWRAIRAVRHLLETVDPDTGLPSGVADSTIPGGHAGGRLCWIADEAARTALFRRRAYMGRLDDPGWLSAAEAGLDVADQAEQVLFTADRAGRQAMLAGDWPGIPGWDFAPGERVEPSSWQLFQVDSGTGGMSGMGDIGGIGGIG